MLTDRERQWLMDEAQDTLGLTALRAKVLMAVLELEYYSIREIGRVTGIQAAEPVRLALEMLIARDLIEVRPTGVRLKGYQAVPGGRLRFILDAVLAAQERHISTTL